MTDMSLGNPHRHLWRYALPLLLGNWLQLSYNAADSIIAGRFISQEALAAEGIAGPVMNLVILAISGLCIGSGVLLTYALQGALGISQEQVSTLCTLLTGFTGLAVLFKVCLPFNWKRALLMILMTVGFYGAALLMPQVFFLVALPIPALFWLGGWMAASLLILWGVGKGMDEMEELAHKRAKAHKTA